MKNTLAVFVFVLSAAVSAQGAGSPVSACKSLSRHYGSCELVNDDGPLIPNAIELTVEDKGVHLRQGFGPQDFLASDFAFGPISTNREEDAEFGDSYVQRYATCKAGALVLTMRKWMAAMGPQIPKEFLDSRHVKEDMVFKKSGSKLSVTLVTNDGRLPSTRFDCR